jgi:hypothetical protein
MITDKLISNLRALGYRVSVAGTSDRDCDFLITEGGSCTALTPAAEQWVELAEHLKVLGLEAVSRAMDTAFTEAFAEIEACSQMRGVLN